MSHEGIQFLTREEQDKLEREQAHARKLTREALTPAKVRVLQTEGTGMEIDWTDGHRSQWNFAWLRNACPCATCVEERKQDCRSPGQPQPRPAQLLPMYEPPARPASVQATGRYALQFSWQDGHTAGIYSWDFLRRNCQCSVCLAERSPS